MPLWGINGTHAKRSLVQRGHVATGKIKYRPSVKPEVYRKGKNIQGEPKPSKQMKYPATSGSHGPGQEADNLYFRFSWTIPHTKREFQALFLTVRRQWTHLIWQYYLIFKRDRKPDDFTGERIHSPSCRFCIYHLPQILRALVLNGLSPLSLSQQQHSAP